MGWVTLLFFPVISSSNATLVTKRSLLGRLDWLSHNKTHTQMYGKDIDKRVCMYKTPDRDEMIVADFDPNDETRAKFERK